MTLWGYWRSSATWRVRIALAWKQVPYDYRPVNISEGHGEQRTSAHVSRNPIGQVPVLEMGVDEAAPVPGLLGPYYMGQSLAILEYLEERFPDPPLLPSHPWLRARSRQMAEIINAGIQPYHNAPSVFGTLQNTVHGDAQAWAQTFIIRGLVAIEETAAATAGKFLVGDQPSFADACLVPQLYSARRFQVDLAALPISRLLRVEAACNELPAFAEAHAERQPDAPGVR
jgi:maleylpyruvate isomerase